MPLSNFSGSMWNNLLNFKCPQKSSCMKMLKNWLQLPHLRIILTKLTLTATFKK